MELEEIEVEAKLAAVEEGTDPSPRTPSIAKVRYTHEGMIDLIIAQPWISQNALAAHFGYSASWISTIIASDSFQARLAERTSQLVDPLIRASADERFKALVLRSQEILMEKLNRPTLDIPDNLALRAFEISSRAAGYGARDMVGGNTVNVHTHLEVLGENLVGLLRRKKLEAIEGELEDE